jgi:hypothetical protein
MFVALLVVLTHSMQYFYLFVSSDFCSSVNSVSSVVSQTTILQSSKDTFVQIMDIIKSVGFPYLISYISGINSGNNGCVSITTGVRYQVDEWMRIGYYFLFIFIFLSSLTIPNHEVIFIFYLLSLLLLF